MDGFGMSDPTMTCYGDCFGNATAADFDHALMSSLFTPGMTSPSLHETRSNMLHFKSSLGNTSANFPMHPQEQHGFGIDMISDNEYSDASTAADGENPRNGCRKRLSLHQVHCLEKCFRVDNKLEPRRKSELARELELKPRQVAIWFQNRRARHKNKQIEKDYDKIAAQYGMIKAQYDKVINENKKLKDQIKCMNEEMSLMKDSDVMNNAKFIQAGLLDAHMILLQHQVMQTQPATDQLMQPIKPELQHAYDNPNDDLYNIACSGGINIEQQVISPASSVFDSSSPVVKPKSSSNKLLTPTNDISYPVVEPAEKRSEKYMQCEQENSVNQKLDYEYELPNLFDLGEPNCFYSSQVDGPPIDPCGFGVIPAADDPFWQFKL